MNRLQRWIIVFMAAITNDPPALRESHKMFTSQQMDILPIGFIFLLTVLFLSR